MIKPLLIEIGVEELPAIPFLKELPNIDSLWYSILEKNALECDFMFNYTPRRLVLWHPEFPLTQNSREEEFFGAPLSVAFKEGKPTPAALSFATKCGVDFKQITHTMKEGKEVLYYKKNIEGQDSKTLIQSMVEDFLKSLNFGKSMRWGSLEESFIRPIRWIGCMLGEEVVDFSLFGVQTAGHSFGHRTISYEPFKYHVAEEYFQALQTHGVILFAVTRKNMIVNDFRFLETQHRVSIEIDNDLLTEVVAITEYPKALLGSFEERFLQLPPEVIITSMKENQRYFPVFKEGKLTNHFIVVSNAISDDYDLIVRGNEKVLRARLSDALFFWENDLKKGLRYEGLKEITYLDGLGSLLDKEVRENKIAHILLAKYANQFNPELLPMREALMERAIMLSKADLLSEMVYEFPELQGLMGSYYAQAMGEDADLCLALKEQYLPNSEESALPSSLFSAIVALSYKLDSLIALFSIGKIPTGNKDPYALRRSVNGIIKIVLDRQIPFDIRADLKTLASHYQAFDLDALESFFIERLYQFFDVNPSIIKAVLNSKERDINTLASKIKAVATVVQTDGFKQSVSTFKRVANIIKTMDLECVLNVDATLFESEYEKNLYNTFKATQAQKYASYEENLNALFGLKPFIDAFFDNVMVNAQETQIRVNRQNLIASIYNAFRAIADIKEISI